MRSLLLLAAAVVASACATTPSTPAATFESRLPALKAVVKAARAQPWGADLKQIPASVIEVGDLASVPYVSFAGAEVELNVYGDPEKPAGVELGTKSESADVRAAVRTFVGTLLSEADRAPIAALADDKQAEVSGLTLEVTSPGAADGFGAWWVTAFHADGVKAAKASVGELNELAQPSDTELNEQDAFIDVGFHPAYNKYPRYRPAAKVWATAYYKENGVYRRRK